MDFLLAILTILFVALVIGAALTFGLALFAVFLLLGVAVAASIVIRQYWLRWRFLRGAKPSSPDVIEVEYRDISDKH